MVFVNTEVNFVDAVLFTMSHVNSVVTSTLEIHIFFQDVAQKVMNNKYSGSFASHFANFFHKNQVHKNFARSCLSKLFPR